VIDDNGDTTKPGSKIVSSPLDPYRRRPAPGGSTHDRQPTLPTARRRLAVTRSNRTYGCFGTPVGNSHNPLDRSRAVSTYRPRPVWRSGVPPELGGPPGALLIMPWKVGSRLGRSMITTRVTCPNPLVDGAMRVKGELPTNGSTWTGDYRKLCGSVQNSNRTLTTRSAVTCTPALIACELPSMT
jgi:hypothetical protein